MLYTFSVGALASTALIASVRFVAVVAELDRTRDALAYEAANAERRRLSSDVHDVLGHSLTAISLKADLARRLLATDRDGAARELDELLLIADEQAGELDAVSTDARTVGFAAEAQAAIALLRSAGIEVDARLELGRAGRGHQHRAGLRDPRGVDEHPPPRPRPARLDRRRVRGRPGARGDRQRRRARERATRSARDGRAGRRLRRRASRGDASDSPGSPSGRPLAAASPRPTRCPAGASASASTLPLPVPA